MTKDSVVNLLIEYRKKMADWVKPVKNVRRLRASSANAFVIGVLFDRTINAEKAWEAAEWFNDSLGDPEDVTALWNSLATMESRRLVGFLRYGYGGYAFHRHYKTFARVLPKVADMMINNYQGDPRNIWNNQRDVEFVRKRLEEFPGIGPALSRMAVHELVRCWGLLGGQAALPKLDIKPDVMVMRVFRGAG